jgi:large subunit ribosomal protein L25
MPEIQIAAEPRTEFGKGAARRARRAQLVPAVVYGHGTDPRHVTLPEHELMLALKSANVLLELDMSGDKELTLPKSVQRDPIRGSIEHVDLIVVKRGEKVVVEVVLHVTGSPVDGGVIDIVENTITVEAEATSIPSELTVDLDKSTPGMQVHASDLVLPAGTTLQIDPDTLVAHVLSPQVEAEPEVEVEETDEAAAEGDAPTEDGDEA